MNIERLKELIYLPSYTAHEMCHYLAARLLGLEAKRYRYNVVFYPNHNRDWRIFIVTLAPPIAGVVFLLFSVWAASYYRDVTPVILALGFNVGWQIPCLTDFYDLWHFFKYGYWEESTEEVKKPPTIGEHLFKWWYNHE